MYQTFIGIDPGATGAIASLSPTGITFIDCPVIKKQNGKTKPNPTLMATELKQLITPDSIIIIENVHAMPGQGVSSMFSFGMGYGCWLGIIAALNIPVEFVTPQCWKKYYNLGPDKEASRAAALLLAEFLRRKLSVNV
ncbi:hypothetical protein, partial [Planktothrix sp.]